MVSKYVSFVLLSIAVSSTNCNFDTCEKQKAPREYLPIPEPLSTNAVKEKLTKGVWTQLYLHYPLDTDIIYIDAVQVRLKFNFSQCGRFLFRTFSFRTHENGECLTFNQTYHSCSKERGIFTRKQPDKLWRQERYFSSCPEKYIWLWICRNVYTLHGGLCRGDGFLALHVRQDPPHNVPWGAVVKDLEKMGLQFEDKRFKLTYIGKPCPV